MFDPYKYLSDVADKLWDLHESTNGDVSDRAEDMYDTLEDNYLEPFRKKLLQANTQAYAQLTQKLQSGLEELDKNIQKINEISDKIQQVSQYAQVFDQIIAVAAKLA